VLGSCSQTIVGVRESRHWDASKKNPRKFFFSKPGGPLGNDGRKRGGASLDPVEGSRRGRKPRFPKLCRRGRIVGAKGAAESLLIL